MKTRIKILLAIAIIACIFAPMLYSQKVASTSMQFLSVMPCARATAMGNAYSVLATGAEAVFWNPAGVALTEGHSLSATYIDWIFDAKQYALSYAASIGNFGSLGLQIQYVDYGKFEETVYSDVAYYPNQPLPFMTGNTFQPSVYLVGISYAKKLSDKFSTGISFKYGHESLYGQKSVEIVDDTTTRVVNTYGDAYLFDVGVWYNTGFRTVRVAAAVQNFGPDIKYAKEKNPAPMLFRVGIAADLFGPNSLLLDQENNRLGVAFDLYQSNDYDQQQHVGLEYEYANTIAFRIGYKFNYDSESLTLGGGIHQKLGRVNFAVDYSYGSAGTDIGSFGNIHRISVGVGLQ